MKTINLKYEYPSVYKSDYFLTVSDNVADFLSDCHRLEHAQKEQLRYNKVLYSHLSFGTSATNIEIETERHFLVERIKGIIRHEMKTYKSSARAYYFFVEEYSIDKIAKLFQIDKSTVSKSIKNSRQIILKLLQKDI